MYVTMEYNLECNAPHMRYNSRIKFYFRTISYYKTVQLEFNALAIYVQF